MGSPLVIGYAAGFCGDADTTQRAIHQALEVDGKQMARPNEIDGSRLACWLKEPRIMHGKKMNKQANLVN